MYKCENCENIFEDAELVETTYSDYLGVESHLGYMTLEYYVCPHCHSEEIEEIDEYDEDDEDEE